MLEVKDLLEFIEKADCRAETCFLNRKGQYQPMSWAEHLIDLSYRAGIKELAECIKKQSILKRRVSAIDRKIYLVRLMNILEEEWQAKLKDMESERAVRE